MSGQADTNFGAVSFATAGEPQRHGATGYVFVVLFAIVALASWKSGAYLGAAFCALGALLSAPLVRERLCEGTEQAALGHNVLTVGLMGLLLVGLDLLGGRGTEAQPVAAVPMAAAQAESTNYAAISHATAGGLEGAYPDFLDREKHKYGQLAGLPVQILDNTGGFLHDLHWSQRGSECILTLSNALIQENDQHFKEALGACVQQAREACAVIPAPDNASDVRTEHPTRVIGAQCDAMLSQAVAFGL